MQSSLPCLFSFLHKPRKINKYPKVSGNFEANRLDQIRSWKPWAGSTWVIAWPPRTTSWATHRFARECLPIVISLWMQLIVASNTVVTASGGTRKIWTPGEGNFLLQRQMSEDRYKIPYPCLIYFEVRTFLNKHIRWQKQWKLNSSQMMRTHTLRTPAGSSSPVPSLCPSLFAFLKPCFKCVKMLSPTASPLGLGNFAMWNETHLKYQEHFFFFNSKAQMSVDSRSPSSKASIVYQLNGLTAV